MYNYAKTLLALKSDTRAVTAVEYAIIGAIMAAVVVAGFTALSGNLSTALASIKFS